MHQILIISSSLYKKYDGRERPMLAQRVHMHTGLFSTVVEVVQWTVSCSFMTVSHVLFIPPAYIEYFFFSLDTQSLFIRSMSRCFRVVHLKGMMIFAINRRYPRHSARENCASECCNTQKEKMNSTDGRGGSEREKGISECTPSGRWFGKEGPISPCWKTLPSQAYFQSILSPANQLLFKEK